MSQCTWASARESLPPLRACQRADKQRLTRTGHPHPLAGPVGGTRHAHRGSMGGTRLHSKSCFLGHGRHGRVVEPAPSPPPPGERVNAV